MRTLPEAVAAATERLDTLNQSMKDATPEEAVESVRLAFTGLGIEVDPDEFAELAAQAIMYQMEYARRAFERGTLVPPFVVMAALWHHGVLAGALAKEDR